jgi:hypothetical protein
MAHYHAHQCQGSACKRLRLKRDRNQLLQAPGIPAGSKHAQESSGGPDRGREIGELPEAGRVPALPSVFGGSCHRRSNGSSRGAANIPEPVHFRQANSRAGINYAARNAALHHQVAIARCWRRSVFAHKRCALTDNAALSLMTKRRHGIDTACFPGGQVTGNQGDSQHRCQY